MHQKKGHVPIELDEGPTFFDKYVLPTWSNVILAVVSSMCLKEYYLEVTGKDIQHFAHVSYLVMIANALSGLLRYTNDETYSDLRILLDYAQQVIVLPMIVTDFLLKYNIAPTEISIIPTVLALVTLFMFVILEYKRQDLTDLNMIVSVAIYLVTGLQHNLYAFLASLILSCAYFAFKRREGVCLRKANQYNLLMAGFALFSLLSFENHSSVTSNSGMWGNSHRIDRW